MPEESDFSEKKPDAESVENGIVMFEALIEETKIVAALKDVVEPVKALAAMVERDCREDVREAVEMKPAVPRPCVVLVK